MQDLANIAGPNYPFWPYYGYFNLGPIQIPPYPPFAGLTDRVTGTIYYLAYSPSNNAITLVTTVPAGLKNWTRIWGPFDGPMVQAQGLRLFVSSGTLSFEYIESGSTFAAGPGPWAFRTDGQTNQVAQLYAVTDPNNKNRFSGLALAVQNTQ